MSVPASAIPACPPRAERLDFLTRGLPVWVLLAMAVGLALAHFAPALARLPAIERFGIPLGLFVMIFPAMTKLHLEDIRTAVRNRTATRLILFFNYLVNPFLLWFFGWLFLRDYPELWIGLILLGVAPCIAMVLVWTDLSRGNSALSITLMAWNSLIQIATTPFFIWLIVGSSVAIDVSLIAQSVLLYLGLPLAFGFALRRYAVKSRGAMWFDTRVQPRLDKLQLAALLATLALIYALQGAAVIANPGFIWRMALPLTLFFFTLYVLVFFVARRFGQDYGDSTAIAYNATGRNFELAIAIAITAFAAQPLVAAATAIGPLLEVPLMLLLVRLSRYWSVRLSWASAPARS